MSLCDQANTTTPEEFPRSRLDLLGLLAAVRPRANSQGPWVGSDPIAPRVQKKLLPVSSFDLQPRLAWNLWSSLVHRDWLHEAWPRFYFCCFLLRLS